MKLILALFAGIVFGGAIQQDALASDKTLRIMVIDTGVDGSNPTIRSHIPKRYRTKFDLKDLDGHGTHVTSTVLQNVCAEVEIISCRVQKKGIRWFDDKLLAECYKKAYREKVDVINASYGGTTFRQEHYFALLLLSQNNTVIVAAAGNDNLDLNLYRFYPASFNLPGIIRVGALDISGRKASFSNYGPGLVWAPGVNIVADMPGGWRQKMSGTSMAAAKTTNRIAKQFCKTIHP